MKNVKNDLLVTLRIILFKNSRYEYQSSFVYRDGNTPKSIGYFRNDDFDLLIGKIYNCHDRKLHNAETMLRFIKRKLFEK